MSYRIYGKPLTHDEMIEIAKSKEPRLYCIATPPNIVVELHVWGIVVDLETKEWKFVFEEQEYFDENEIIFKTRRSAELYLKRFLKNE
jgi:hypothetical protein